MVRQSQDEANNALLLATLRDVDDRRANFACTLVAIRSADDPSPLVAVGRWNGEILRELEGAGGFGYDPLMFIPAFGATVASLAKDVKNAHSHRAIAAGADAPADAAGVASLSRALHEDRRIEASPSAKATGGFGYDPLMFVPAFGTDGGVAVARKSKNAHSHRAIAAAQMQHVDAAGVASLRRAASIRR